MKSTFNSSTAFLNLNHAYVSSLGNEFKSYYDLLKTPSTIDLLTYSSNTGL